MDAERAARVDEMLRQSGLRAVICRLPQHVLMLTGYFPLLGNSFCVVSRGRGGKPELRLMVPSDERDLVAPDAADEVRTYTEETLEYIGTTLPAVHQPLGNLLAAAGFTESDAVGYEGGHTPVVAGYTQMGVPGPATRDLYQSLLPQVTLRDATPLLDEMAAVMTQTELEAVRRAAHVAHSGFIAAREAIHVGAKECDVAAAAQGAVLRVGQAMSRTGCVLPHAHVMAGTRSALAYRAFNLTSNAPIAEGEPVVVQMEVCVDGYWAELTRTFFAGAVAPEWRQVHQACLAAQDAAMSVIRDGTRGRDVDSAARHVLEQASYGAAFKHGLGHGVGFQAINHAAPPILHPASDSVLRAGMLHNMEPAVYLEGKGGLRLNDNVAVRRYDGERISQEIPREMEWLVTPA